jgi:hypothetical protein
MEHAASAFGEAATTAEHAASAAEHEASAILAKEMSVVQHEWQVLNSADKTTPHTLQTKSKLLSDAEQNQIAVSERRHIHHGEKKKAPHLRSFHGGSVVEATPATSQLETSPLAQSKSVVAKHVSAAPLDGLECGGLAIRDVAFAVVSGSEERAAAIRRTWFGQVGAQGMILTTEAKKNTPVDFIQALVLLRKRFPSAKWYCTALHTALHCTLHCTLPCILHILYCTCHTALHTAHTILHIPYCTAYCTYHAAHTMLHIPYCTYHTAHTILHIPYCTYHTAHTILHYILHCTVHALTTLFSHRLCIIL